MAEVPIAVQLFSVREDCARDLPGTLKQIAEMGYDGVEFAGYHGHSAADLRVLLADLGLQVAGTHIGIDTLVGDELEATIAFNQALGNRFLIVPGLPTSYCDSVEAWKRTAEVFNAIAEKLTPHGMFTGYHNHAAEVQELQGEIPLHVLLDNTSDSVCLQPDTGNALDGGADIAPYIARYPGRSRTVHLKEYSETNKKAVIGEGDTDWMKCFEVCESVGGTQWYIVEQETYAAPPLECVRRCLVNLQGMRQGNDNE